MTLGLVLLGRAGSALALCRFNARIMPMRAILSGPSHSATSNAVMYAVASTKRGRGQPSNFAEVRCVQKRTDRSICLRLNGGVSNTEILLAIRPAGSRAFR